MSIIFLSLQVISFSAIVAISSSCLAYLIDFEMSFTISNDFWPLPMIQNDFLIRCGRIDSLA